MLAATELTHITWMINQTGAGGYSPSDPKVSAGMRKMGYNLHIPQANFNATASGTFKVGVTMQNNGVAPFYYPWTTVIGLRNAAGVDRQDLGHQLGPAPGAAAEDPGLPGLERRAPTRPIWTSAGRSTSPRTSARRACPPARTAWC